MQKACIIIPCYNESARLDAPGFTGFAAAHPHFYFLFMDDGSTDHTSDCLALLTDTMPQQFRYRTRKENKGKAETIREGMLEAMQWKPFDWIGYLDADLSTPLSGMDALFQKALQHKEATIVFGSREKTKTNSIQRNNLRHIFGRIYAGFITTCLHLDIYDTQCGAKLVRSEWVPELFKTSFIDRWLFDVELFCRVKQLPAPHSSILEVPLDSWVEKGDSRIRGSDILKIPMQTIRLFRKYL